MLGLHKAVRRINSDAVFMVLVFMEPYDNSKKVNM